jgi:hypothetical protein
MGVRLLETIADKEGDRMTVRHVIAIALYLVLFIGVNLLSKPNERVSDSMRILSNTCIVFSCAAVFADVVLRATLVAAAVLFTHAHYWCKPRKS